MSRKTELKIKIMSLAAESRIIRREEKKWPGRHAKRLSLREHRIGDVRTEARCALLAYGFLRGRLYRQVENRVRPVDHAHKDKAMKPIDWERVIALVARFGGLDKRDARQKLAEWADFEPRSFVELAGLKADTLTPKKAERAYRVLRHTFEDPAEFKHAYAEAKLALTPPRPRLTPEEARARHEAEKAAREGDV